jgi:uncharacterized protein
MALREDLNTNIRSLEHFNREERILKWLFRVIITGLLLLSVGPALFAENGFRFSGGPLNGTFQELSEEMIVRLAEKIPGLNISQLASRGSVDNIRKVETRNADFGICFSSDLFLSRNGLLAGDRYRYSKVRSLSFLYHSVIHLVALKQTELDRVTQMKNRRIALGTPGSGSAVSAERVFKLFGLWTQIERQTLNYKDAAAGLKKNQVDAIWTLAQIPDPMLMSLAGIGDVELLDIYDTAVDNGLTDYLPFYQRYVIPAGTYAGLTGSTETLSDASVWIVNDDVDEDIVYQALKVIFPGDGLHMVEDLVSTAGVSSISKENISILSPLHKGAVKFWREKGVIASEPPVSD